MALPELHEQMNAYTSAIIELTNSRDSLGSCSGRAENAPKIPVTTACLPILTLHREAVLEVQR